MSKPIFIFFNYGKYFKVNIENLEKLTIEQIKNIENFVYDRKGIFDFNTYSFTIQKKIDFYEFTYLLKHTNIDAICKEQRVKTTQYIKISFGKYKGLLYSDLPDSYLLWLKNNYKGKDIDIIDAEFKARAL